jgi:hypothetical protein
MMQIENLNQYRDVSAGLCVISFVIVSKLTCPGRTLEMEFEIPLKIVRFLREIRCLLFF